jgi:hypothetical protein
VSRGVFLGLVLAATVGAFLAAVALGSAQAPACQLAPNGLAVVVDLSHVRHEHLLEHERRALADDVPDELSPRADGRQPRVLTWDPGPQADRRRREDLRGTRTLAGYDRDEYPPASAAESGLQLDGTSASVAYVASSENRSGGQLLGAAMRGYCAGQPFVIEATP